MPRLTTFPARGEFEKAVALLESLGAPFQTLSPEPAFCRVGVPGIIVEPEAQAELQNSDIMVGRGAARGVQACLRGLARRPARGAPPGGRRTGGPTARALDWHGKGVNG